MGLGGGGREYGVSMGGVRKSVGVWESVWGECNDLSKHQSQLLLETLDRHRTHE